MDGDKKNVVSAFFDKLHLSKLNRNQTLAVAFGFLYILVMAVGLRTDYGADTALYRFLEVSATSFLLYMTYWTAMSQRP
jgi:hypothetical protein